VGFELLISFVFVIGLKYEDDVMIFVLLSWLDDSVFSNFKFSDFPLAFFLWGAIKSPNDLFLLECEFNWSNSEDVCDSIFEGGDNEGNEEDIVYDIEFDDFEFLFSSSLNVKSITELFSPLISIYIHFFFFFFVYFFLYIINLINII